MYLVQLTPREPKMLESPNMNNQKYPPEARNKTCGSEQEGMAWGTSYMTNIFLPTYSIRRLLSFNLWVVNHLSERISPS